MCCVWLSSDQVTLNTCLCMKINGICCGFFPHLYVSCRITFLFTVHTGRRQVKTFWFFRSSQWVCDNRTAKWAKEKVKISSFPAPIDLMKFSIIRRKGVIHTFSSDRLPSMLGTPATSVNHDKEIWFCSSCRRWRKVSPRKMIFILQAQLAWVQINTFSTIR